ncbi:MAG: hypothetical protein RIQ62_1969 [Bacteroidota bacterium]|jgi:hypothetical protein
MKKAIILSLMIVSAFSVDAQRKRTRTATSQGNVAVGLGIGINSNKWDHDYSQAYVNGGNPLTVKGSSISFNPRVGYMVVDNLELGAMIDITNNKTATTYRETPTLLRWNDKETKVNFDVYLMKYFPLNNWFSFTTSARLGMGTGTYSTEQDSSSVTSTLVSGNTSSVHGGVNFGLAFTPYNAFSLQAGISSLNISSSKDDPDGTNDTVNTTDFGFNVMPRTAHIDFVWYFGRGLWNK